MAFKDILEEAAQIHEDFTQFCGCFYADFNVEVVVADGFVKIGDVRVIDEERAKGLAEAARCLRHAHG